MFEAVTGQVYEIDVSQGSLLGSAVALLDSNGVHTSKWRRPRKTPSRPALRGKRRTPVATMSQGAALERARTR